MLCQWTKCHTCRVIMHVGDTYVGGASRMSNTGWHETGGYLMWEHLPSWLPVPFSSRPVSLGNRCPTIGTRSHSAALNNTLWANGPYYTKVQVSQLAWSWSGHLPLGLEVLMVPCLHVQKISPGSFCPCPTTVRCPSSPMSHATFHALPCHAFPPPQLT